MDLMEQEVLFENIERKVYPRTFLNTVFVVFSYTIDSWSEESMNSIKAFLKDYFSLSVDISADDFEIGLAIDSREGDFSYFFSKGYIGVKYMKQNYVSFPETMMPLIYRLTAFIKNCFSLAKIDKIEIRKINTWMSKKQEMDASIDNVMVNSLLSSELISRSTPGSAYEGLSSVREFAGTSNGYRFMIRYGFDNRISSKENGVGLILDETITQEDVSFSEVEKALMDGNTLLYNIFHWSVSPTLLSYMSKEQ